MAKLLSIVGGLFLSTLIASAALADVDISAQHLLDSWKGEDPGMRMVAEVISSVFASGFCWGGDAPGKRAYCAPPDFKGPQLMGAFETFVGDHPALAERPYGEAMAATLRTAFPCKRARNPATREPFIARFATVIDVGRPRLWPIGRGPQQFGQPRVALIAIIFANLGRLPGPALSHPSHKAA
jgi:hypothetical protein